MIVLIEMNYNSTEKPYHLNTQSVAYRLVGSMFGWRKKESSNLQNICPYCGTPNEIGAKECKLCYYDLTVSAREQPMATPSSAESEIMTTLLGDDTDDSQGEDYAVEAVLSLDEVTIEIDQFAADDSAEEGKFDFITSSGPTLSEVQDYADPEEVELSPEDAPESKVDFIVPESNPLEEVAEPIHTGQGSLFLDSVKSDDDFTGSVGPNKSRNMEPELLSEENQPSTVSLASAISNEVIEATPELPDIPDVSNDQTSGNNIAIASSTPEIPDLPDDETPEVPDIPVDQSVQSEATQTSVNHTTAAPMPQFNGRIWPWPAKQAWDERQVYREVVAMLELIKTGKLAQTAQQLDNLGPHLDGNLDMLAHIGTIMRYLGREEHLQWMLKMAQTNYPNDSNVVRAIAHLS